MKKFSGGSCSVNRSRIPELGKIISFEAISNDKGLNTQQDDDILPAAIRKTIQENHPHEKNHRQHGQQ